MLRASQLTLCLSRDSSCDLEGAADILQNISQILILLTIGSPSISRPDIWWCRSILSQRNKN